MADPLQPSDGSDRQSVLKDIDVATLLSPPPDLSTRLSTSAKTYETVVASATSILTKSSVDLDAFRSADPDDKTSGMRETIMTAKADFARFADREVDLCKNLNAYGDLLKTLVSKVDIPVLVLALSGRLETFRKAMNEDSQDRATRAAKILKHVETLTTRLADATAEVENLNQQATAMEEGLRRQNVGYRLLEALKKLFHLDDDEDGALTQISIILGVAKEYLRGDFDTLSKNKKQMQAFIDKVKALQSSLESVRASMLAMANSMKSSVEANAALVGVWDTLSTNMALLKTHAKAPVGASDQYQITLNWEQAKLAANEAVSAITGGSITPANLVASQSAASSTATSSIKYPTSKAEVELFKLAGDVSVDRMLVEPEKFSTLSHLATLPEIRERHFEGFARMSAISVASSDDEKKKAAEELMKKLGPPAIESIKQQLDGLSGDCKQVTNTFSSILQVPFLQNLSILNPFKNSSTPSEPTDLNMREVVTRYKDKYVALQDETRLAAKGLISYATIQLALLPRVEIDPTKAANLKPGDGKITAETYYMACHNAISDYTAKATDLRKKHSDFMTEWTQAQNNIIQRIAECRATAGQLKTRIQEKKDEYKHKTIIGVLEILGGVACFALGFFVPFLAPVAWGAGAALIGVGIKELIDRGILDDAINDLQSKFDAANNAANGLEQLKAPFQLVADKVQSLIGIWNGIEQALISINMNVSTLQDMPSGTIEPLWVALLPDNTKNWQTVKELVAKYTDEIQ